MKRITSITLTVLIFFTIFTPVYAEKVYLGSTNGINVYWDLTEMPDLSDYKFDDCWASDYETMFEDVEVSSDGLDKLNNVLKPIIQDVEVLPVDNPNYNEKNYKFCFIFNKTDMERVRVMIFNDGMSVAVEEFPDNKATRHYGYMFFDITELISQIINITEPIIEQVENDRESDALREKEERAKYQTEVTKLEKLCVIDIPEIEGYDSVTDWNMGTYHMEMGIGSYKKMEDNALHYVFYVDMGPESETSHLFITDVIDENNILHFDGTTYHKDGYDGKYYIYTQDSGNRPRTVQITLDSYGLPNKIDYYIEKSAESFHANAEGIRVDGEFKDYGNIKFNKQNQEVSNPYETEVTAVNKICVVDINTLIYSGGVSGRGSAEFGVLSYKPVDGGNAVNVFYFEYPGLVGCYISDIIDKNNEIKLYEKQLYRKDDGKYYINSQGSAELYATITLDIDSLGILNRFYMNTKGGIRTSEKGQFTVTGKLANYVTVPENDNNEAEKTVDDDKNQEKSDVEKQIEDDAEKIPQSEEVKSEEPDIAEQDEVENVTTADETSNDESKETDLQKTEKNESVEAELSVIITPQAAADTLYALGLFKGTEKGYELEKSFTRAEGAVMLVRLLGKEFDALYMTENTGVFSDMENHWAAQYVSYCYKNGITKGTGADTYSPDDIMTGEEYIALIMRSLGHKYVDPDNAHVAAAELSLASSGDLRKLAEGAFTRDKMVFVSYNALGVLDSEGVSLAEKLIESGAIPKAKAEELGVIKGNIHIDF